MIGAGEAIRIEDNNPNSGRVTQEEFDDQIGATPLNDGEQIYIEGLGTYTYDAAVWGNNWQDFINAIRNRLISQSAEGTPPAAGSQAQLEQASIQMASSMTELQNMEAELARLQAQTTPDQNAIRQAESQRDLLKARLQRDIRLMEQANRSLRNQPNSGIDASVYRAAGLEPPSGETAGSGNVSANTTSQPTPTSQPTAMTASLPAGFVAPSGWGAQSGIPQFSTDAYMQSVAMEDNILASFDSVLKGQTEGKKLMMLFFYFARMAESGDMGAMYQFMKFITYIISKDKSKQQIDMGKKLIELQDLSRQWTDKLLNMQTNATDPNASNEFMKVMTQVKSETDAIATSQKLIAQMMEEFAQIVETLTNTTKTALETNGRILRTVSTVR